MISALIGCRSFMRFDLEAPYSGWPETQYPHDALFPTPLRILQCRVGVPLVHITAICDDTDPCKSWIHDACAAVLSECSASLMRYGSTTLQPAVEWSRGDSNLGPPPCKVKSPGS